MVPISTGKYHNPRTVIGWLAIAVETKVADFKAGKKGGLGAENNKKGTNRQEWQKGRGSGPPTRLGSGF
jgi:hypothetical protein